MNIILRSGNNTSRMGISDGVELSTSCGRRIRGIGWRRQVGFCRDARWWGAIGLIKKVGLTLGVNQEWTCNGKGC